MKKILIPGMMLFASIATFVGCSKNDISNPDSPISGSVLSKIADMGFGTSSVVRHEDGYLVEGDIIITEEQLNRKVNGNFLRVGDEEQYRTTNLVTGLPRVITVSMDPKFTSAYIAAIDEAISRYNAQGLRITFQRVASGGNISIVTAGGNYLASAGFPTAGGDPYNQIKVNTRQLDGQPLGTKASVLAHEMGHCIGFRHTDYMNRQYSCGGSPSNEGASTVGAILIPGTPSGPDPNSWMLACIGAGQDRPFNANDRTALGYLYK
jgi:hypothetical protein